MMFEPRSRGFCGPLLGQPFYGWYRTRTPVVLLGARTPAAAGRGLGWGDSGAPLAARLLALGKLRSTHLAIPLSRSHHFQKLIPLIPRDLSHRHSRNRTTPPYPGIGATAPTKGMIIMPTNAQIKANRKNAKKSTGPRSEEGKTP